MHRITIADAQRDLSDLVHRVCAEGVGFELAEGDAVVARLVPAVPRSPTKVQDLATLLASLPKLEEDADAFAADISSIRREFPAEKSAWD